MTFTLYEGLAVLATIGFATGLVAFVRLARQLQRSAAELEYTARRVSELTPAAQRFLANGESELEELRVLTQKTSQVAGHVTAVTGEASAATLHLLRGLEGHVVDRYGAIVAGTRAGLAMLKRARGNGDEGDAHGELEPSFSDRPERMENHE
jgi:hypothetical protein